MWIFSALSRTATRPSPVRKCSITPFFPIRKSHSSCGFLSSGARRVLFVLKLARRQFPDRLFLGLVSVVAGIYARRNILIRGLLLVFSFSRRLRRRRRGLHLLRSSKDLF